jgi:hypothetical protein
MTIYKFTGGTLAKSSEVNSNFNLTLRSAGLTWINMLKDRALTMPADGGIFAEAYTANVGRQTSVVTAETTAVFDTNAYYNRPFVEIRATSLTLSDFQLNDCNIELISTGVWRVFCTVAGSYKVQQAKILTTLFYGNNASTYDPSILKVTGLTSLRTNMTDLVGKKCVRARSSWSTGSNGITTYTGTFSNTADNSGTFFLTKTENTSSTIIRQFRASASNIVVNTTTNVNNLITNNSSWNQNNPLNMQLFIQHTASGTRAGFIEALAFFNAGTVSWATSGSPTVANVDFAVDHSVPNFTLESDSSVIVHRIPAKRFKSTSSSSIVVADIDNTDNLPASAEFKLATENWSSFSETVYVIIETPSILQPSQFQINNCDIRYIGSNKWILFCTTGTNAVKRAQIYKTLFYGSNGTDARLTTTYIPTITKIKTSVARDVGKKGFFASQTTSSGTGLGRILGTFTDTSTNSSCSVWSNITAGSGGSYSRLEFPSGTTIHTVTASATSNQIGTDTEANELNNPATFELEISTATGTGTAQAVVLAAGDINYTLPNIPDTWNLLSFGYVFESVSESIPNTTEETDWLSLNEIVGYTPFTTEISTIQIRLLDNNVRYRGIYLASERP